MFTGIIETVGKVLSVEQEGSNKIFAISSSISSALKIDQSLSHNGVCLTVTGIYGNQHEVTAIDETLLRTNLGQWHEGTAVNLERCLPANGRIDGHFVQGHVDTVTEVMKVEDKNGSWLFTFDLPKKYRPLVVEKGSIAINGVSLTVVEAGKKAFSVAIIPYTYDNTAFHILKKGDAANIEFDVLGKYVHRSLAGSSK